MGRHFALIEPEPKYETLKVRPPSLIITQKSNMTDIVLSSTVLLPGSNLV